MAKKIARIYHVDGILQLHKAESLRVDVCTDTEDTDHVRYCEIW